MNSVHEERTAVTLLSGGRKIFGILHLPLAKDNRPFPAVLFCHGFGGNKSGRHRLYVRLAERLTSAGIAAFRFDFRGCGDSEGSFNDITIESQLQDAAECVTFLSKQSSIDISRFGICGSSLGGAIACLLAGQTPQTRAITLLAPFFDAKPWMDIQTSEQKKGNLEFDTKSGDVRFSGQLLSKECLKQFTAFSLKRPLAQIADRPLLLIQGCCDTTMGQYHIEQYKKERLSSLAPTEMVELPLSGHDFGDPAEQELLFDEATDWFKTYLTPVQ